MADPVGPALGDLAAAQEEINHCLKLDPLAGISLYAAACVLARAAEKEGDGEARRRAEDQAIDFLTRALQQGYGRATAADDPDLRSLRHRPELQALLRRHQTK